MTTQLEKDLSPEGHKKRSVELGPLFTSGAIVLIYGLLSSTPAGGTLSDGEASGQTDGWSESGR